MGGHIANLTGKWQMANGKWQMANGKWQMADRYFHPWTISLGPVLQVTNRPWLINLAPELQRPLWTASQMAGTTSRI